MLDLQPTFIVLVLDESGSMNSVRDDTVGGVNAFIEDQKKLPAPCRMSIVKFNSRVMSSEPKNLNEIQPLTALNYIPAGYTALLDAVADSIRLAERTKTADERVLILTITDGEENASRETTVAQIKELVKSKESTGMWTFTYMGPAPEKWADHGITSHAGNNICYVSADPASNYHKMSASTKSFRGGTRGQSVGFYDSADTAPMDSFTNVPGTAPDQAVVPPDVTPENK